ncbi:mitochondrial dicarboxylate carrier protein [Grosmannia clavigera kw1407]|uniref:Mitochondrial thiamine pyrophosphate carrier 1 n=1 Tax=Grosmannia clavigera (strain kw1407 / UAMH 11150) TaxID=655863 RepID=F0XD83_GROCL|nr:mitochondrial dicarboxylate carrier protein [Grosmannia clavigera kw1407]EFX04823.1 mitochondrial dicarboxylate carrier protein [Grosmannia clavigera kw1407]
MSSKGERLKDEGSKLQVVIAGGTAGLIARFLVAPLDVVKIRLQLQTHSLSDPRSQLNLHGGPTYKGTLPTMRHIIAHEGLTGLWKGNVPAELMYVCYSAIQFTAYRTATLLVQQAAGGPGVLPPSIESFVSGAAAGAAATTATYPLDLLRTRFAAQGSKDRVYTNLRHAVREIARDEGLRGFFRGLGPAILQIAPFMGTFFAVYEGLRAPLLRAHLADRLPFGGGDAAAGAVAAVAAKTAVFPLDLVRKRIQVQGPTRGRYVHKNIPVYDGSVGRTLRKIARREGIRGLYRGLTVSLLKAAPASTITVWTYERVLHLLMRLDKHD